MPADGPAPEHVVILIHGIRDFALWQVSIQAELEKQGFKVENTNYYRFNLLQFLVPVSYFRRKAISRVWNQIRIIKQNNPSAPLSVIAHSFGTYVIAHLMQKNFDIQFHRVILCGSVLCYDFPFEQFQNRYAPPIINEVGTRDIWPAIAESITAGYGSVGTYGFHRPLVRDRWHNGARHGFFLEARFCRQFWVPFLRDGRFIKGAAEPEPPRVWLQVLSIIKIKYVLGLLLALSIGFGAYQFSGTLIAQFYESQISIPNPLTIGTREDLDVALRKIERRKKVLSKDQVSKISLDLTNVLISSHSSISRPERRYMNKSIIRTLLLLNDSDLSQVWRSLPADLDLSYLDLSNMNLRGVVFRRAFLIYTDFKNFRLDDATFDDCWVRNADFSEASISNTRFQGTDWFNALHIPADIGSGWPVPVSEWMDCPENYKFPHCCE